MDVSDNETDVHLLEIPDYKLPEKLMKYRISIASIEVFEPGGPMHCLLRWYPEGAKLCLDVSTCVDIYGLERERRVGRY